MSNYTEKKAYIAAEKENLTMNAGEIREKQIDKAVFEFRKAYWNCNACYIYQNVFGKYRFIGVVGMPTQMGA